MILAFIIFVCIALFFGWGAALVCAALFLGWGAVNYYRMTPKEREEYFKKQERDRQRKKYSSYWWRVRHEHYDYRRYASAWFD